MIYVYCVTNTIPESQAGDSELYFVFHQGLYAVVREVSEEDFSEENLKRHLTEMNWVEPRAREHVQVISWVMQTAPVVPFKFGTIFKTEQNVRKMLEEYSHQLHENLVKFKGKEEWSVKIYCDFDVLNANIAHTSEQIKHLDQEILSSTPGKAFLLKKKRQELVQDEVQRTIRESGQASFEQLQACARETVINKLLPKEVTDKEHDMILNAVYLVLKENVATFLTVVESLKQQYHACGFEFDCTGPWPPYNFTSIKEKA
jgi:hypothetical protein